jgi:hypothetical protein
MNKFEYKNLTPFKWFVLENFPFIEADFDALTEWQLFCKLGKEMNKIINSENTLGTQMETITNAFIELQNYVNNYFDNLDLQEEVNNKLNEMAESGELSEIIEQYLNINALIIFNNINEMKLAENIRNGSTVKTLGKNNYLDGKGNIYKIRNILNNDIIDDENIIALKNENLIAELIGEVNFENIYNYDDNISSKYNNIDFYTDYDSNSKSIIYITRIRKDKIQKLSCLPTNGNPIENINTNRKSVIDFSKTNNNYDLFLNSGLNGINIFDGIVNTTTNLDSPFYCGFNNNNEMKFYDAVNNVINSDTLINDGIVNAFVGYSPIIQNKNIYDYKQITNNESTSQIAKYFKDYIVEQKHPRQLIGDDDNYFYVFSIFGRILNSHGMNYEELITYFNSKNLNNVFNCDGGGSMQTVYNKSNIFEPSQEIINGNNNFRIVPVCIGIKLEEV